MTDNNDSLMREVKGELDREKYELLWKKYGTYVIGGAIAFVLAVGGYKYWAASKQAAIWEAGGAYEAALALTGKEGSEGSDAAKAQSEFEALAKNSPGGYRVLAQLQVAGRQVAAGKKNEALAIYESLSKDKETDEILRDFAALQAATLRVGDADWTEMENRLTNLSGGTSAWRHSALQLLGVAAFDAGKIEKAREVFEQLLGGPKVPTSIRDRASLFMARIVAHDMKTERKSEKSSSEPAAANAPASSTPGTTSEGEKPMVQDGAKTGAKDGASDGAKATDGSSTSTNSP